MDVRLHFKRNERDEECQGKLQGSSQIEKGGVLGGANIIITLHNFLGTTMIVIVVLFYLTKTTSYSYSYSMPPFSNLN